MLQISKQAIPPSLVISLLLIAIGLTFFSPLYPDEIAYKVFLERFFINGGFKQSVTPFCPEGFLVRPDAWLIPAAAFWSMISWFGSSWLSYRILPIIGLLTIFGVLISHNIKKGSRNFWPLLLFITLGPTLYGLVLLRPEILILSASMLLFMLGRTMIERHRETHLYLYSLAMMLLFSIIAYVHPKALYLLIIVVTSIIVASLNVEQKARRVFYIGFFTLGALLIAHAGMDLHRAQFLSCKSVSTVTQFMDKQAVNPVDLFVNPSLFIDNLKLALGWDALKLSVNRMYFALNYEAEYLPGSNELTTSSRLANALILATTFFFTSYILWKLIRCWRFLQNARDRKQFYLIMSVILSLLIPFFLNITKHFYEIAFLSGTLMIAAALLWPFNIADNNQHQPRQSVHFLCLLVLISMLSVILAYNCFTKAFLKGYEGPSLSFRTEKANLGKEIRQALNAVSIPETDPIIADDLTYDAVRDHPVIITVTHLMHGASEPSVMKLTLDNYHVHYGVIRCPMYFQFSRIVPAEILSFLTYDQQSYMQPPVLGKICVFKTSDVMN